MGIITTKVITCDKCKLVFPDEENLRPVYVYAPNTSIQGRWEEYYLICRECWGAVRKVILG